MKAKVMATGRKINDFFIAMYRSLSLTKLAKADIMLVLLLYTVLSGWTSITVQL